MEIVEINSQKQEKDIHNQQILGCFLEMYKQNWNNKLHKQRSINL